MFDKISDSRLSLTLFSHHSCLYDFRPSKKCLKKTSTTRFRYIRVGFRENKLQHIFLFGNSSVYYKFT